MDQEILNKLAEQEELLKKIYESTEKTRRYMFWTFVAGIIVIVLPLLGLLFVIPQFISTIGSGTLPPGL